MPQHHVIQAGSRSQTALVYAADANHPARARPGLTAATPGAAAAYHRAGEAAVHDLPLVAGEPGTHRAGGFVEIDPELLPGVYRLDLPDEMLAQGASQALLVLRFPGASIEPVDIALVAFDPQDADRIGMRCLEWQERWSFLRQGLPRLAEMEMALQEQAARDQ